MPRGFRRGFSTTVAPPKVIKMTKPEADLTALSAAYEWMPVNKTIAFHMAFEWYAVNATALLFSEPLTPESQKSYERGLKSKNLGDSTTIEEERFHAWTTSLRLYEKTWAKVPLPKVDDALAATTVGPRVTNIQRVLTNLNTAFSESGMKFGVTMEKDRSVELGMILIPEGELNQLIGAPPLKTILGEAVTVAKVISITTLEDGSKELDGGLFMSNLPKVMEQVTNWAVNTDEKLTKPIGKVIPISSTKTHTPRAPKVPGAPSTPSTKPIFDLDHVIHVITTVGLKGKRGAVAQATTDGMTVREYIQTAVTPSFGRNNKSAAFVILDIMVNKGMVTVTP